MSHPALAILYWLHMLATVAWLGSLFALAWLVVPAARKALDAAAYAALMDRLSTRLNTLAWFCLLVLAGTGMFQMSENANYGGFLAINNAWAVAILAKHIAFGVMTLLSAYLTWGLFPVLKREAFKASRGAGSPEVLASLRSREAWLLRANLVLAVIILLLTAFARAA